MSEKSGLIIIAMAMTALLTIMGLGAYVDVHKPTICQSTP